MAEQQLENPANVWFRGAHDILSEDARGGSITQTKMALVYNCDQGAVSNIYRNVVALSCTVEAHVGRMVWAARQAMVADGDPKEVFIKLCTSSLSRSPAPYRVILDPEATLTMVHAWGAQAPDRIARLAKLSLSPLCADDLSEKLGRLAPLLETDMTDLVAKLRGHPRMVDWLLKLGEGFHEKVVKEAEKVVSGGSGAGMPHMVAMDMIGSIENYDDELENLAVRLHDEIAGEGRFIAPEQLVTALGSYMERAGGTVSWTSEDHRHPYHRGNERCWVATRPGEPYRHDRSKGFLRRGMNPNAHGLAMALLITKMAGYPGQSQHIPLPSPPACLSAAVARIDAIVQNYMKENPAGNRADCRRACVDSLRNYFASAVVMPIRDFAERAKECSYDPAILRSHYQTSYENAVFRLANLRTEHTGGFRIYAMKVDGAARVIKQTPNYSGKEVTGIALGCNRWNVVSVLTKPGTVQKQLSELENHLYANVARTVGSRGSGMVAGWDAVAYGVGLKWAHRLAQTRDLVRPKRKGDKVVTDAQGNPQWEPAVPVVKIGRSCLSCMLEHCESRAYPPLLDHDPR